MLAVPAPISPKLAPDSGLYELVTNVVCIALSREFVMVAVSLPQQQGNAAQTYN